MPTDKESKTFIIGLSGPSSSGKTTLARLLRGVFNVEHNNVSIKLFILHEDDFYKSDADIPQRTITSTSHGTRTVQDWDCVESLNLPALDKTIRHVKRHGSLPAELTSKEDQNTVGEVGVSDDEVAVYRGEVVRWIEERYKSDGDDEGSNSNGSGNGNANTNRSKQQVLTICILDGFLLFPPPPPPPPPPPSSSPSPPQPSPTSTTNPIEKPLSPMTSLHTTLSETLDLKLFLPSTRQRTIDRRAKRTGYVTMEGFWADPPGYVEDVVWPNYARDHAWMFDNNKRDVDEGRVEKGGGGSTVVEREGIVVGPGVGEVPMRELLRWGVGVVWERLLK